MQVSRQIADEASPMVVAIVATVLLHAALGAWLSSPLSFALRPLVVPTKVVVTPLPVDPAKLPPQLRLAETAPRGNREVPEAAPLIAARNQTAAQPDPEKSPTRSALPKSAGEDAEALRLAQARPRAIDQPDSSESKGEAGTSSVAVSPVPVAVAPQPRPQPIASATPRASLPTGTSGLLLRNPVGVGRAGMLALDARFSSYGDYSQRMLEAIQASWWSLIERARFDDFAAGYVIVRFRIHRDGTVTDAEVIASTVPTLAALTCKDAVALPAPYDAWRADMVAMLGDDESVTITFHYR